MEREEVISYIENPVTLGDRTLKIVVGEGEGNNREDWVVYILQSNGEAYGRYRTNSAALDRCGCCGEFYVGQKRCYCTEDYFDVTIEELKEIVKSGEYDFAEVY